MGERETEQFGVRAPQPLEAALETGVNSRPRPSPRAPLGVSGLELQQVADQGRHQGARQEIRGEHREHDCQCKRQEKRAGGPGEEATGTNTMQMHSVETKAGTAISRAPSKIACSGGL